MGIKMASWTDGYWWSNDSLRLHYRDYAGPAERPPILCIPGLTRNARDFEGVAARLAGEWRVICVDLRGRGESAYAKDAMSYVPLTYLQDMEALIRELELHRFVLFGTSLGGLITMLLAMSGDTLIAGALLNDIGPDLDPRWGRDQWLVFAKRLCKLTPAGRIVLDYDMRIAEPFKVPGGETGFDMWRAFDGLKGIASLVVRGALSDLLTEATVERMLADNPAMEAATVPDVGHSPTLEEPEAAEAIDRLLARVAG